MDHKERFDQLESMLVDALRKQDQHSDQLAQIINELNRQGEAISRQGAAINRQGEAIGRQGEAISQLGELANQQGEAINRQGKLLEAVSEKLDGVLEVLKLSEARHTLAEQRHNTIVAELERLGKRTDAAVEGLRILLQRQQVVDTRLDSAVQTQLQMMQLMRLDAETVAELAQRFPALEGQEPRLKRLEDEVFRAAS